jgi:hypothetical protein
LGKGIRKISENVIADKRSLLLVVSSTDDVVDTKAMPKGMLKVTHDTRGISIKINDGEYRRLNADETLDDNSVGTNLLKDSSITNIKIADKSIDSAKIMDGSIVTASLKDDCVTSDKIANEAIGEMHLQENSIGGKALQKNSVAESHIRNRSITSAKIAEGTITYINIAENGIKAENIRDGAITSNKIGENAIKNKNYAERSITGDKIGLGTIEGVNIGEKQIASGVIQDQAIITRTISNKSVTREKLADDIEMLITQTEQLKNVVQHDGRGNITGQGDGSTALGDVYAQRVYNIAYMDIAEGYVPGELLEPGDIVAMHEDGKVYKTKSINDCIVGVVSNEYANCFGASKEELLSGAKVAVGLIGKIHVNVKGPVRLGQRISISSSDAGIGVANWMNTMNIGQALETKSDCDFGTIHKVLVQVRPM